MKNVFAFLFVLLTVTGAIAQEKPQVVPGNIIVQVPSARIADVIQSNQYFNGQATHLKLNRLLSAPMAAYLLEFDPSIHHRQFLQQLWNHPSVTLIQLNHYIQDRAITPNDPQLNQQWWHVNNGGAGGTADADIDSDEAWEITTGGLTATGDTIVVCVVDDGGDLNHPDLMANNWVNYHEIPNNNIDDDGNGYIDDYLGWNPVDDDDNVDNGSHGVNVAGMIGAVGNNSTGVVGVNWNVKIMNTTYGNIGGVNNPNEANVIEAYSYPLAMRRLYEQTNGAKGAFVVATNSSWGIDNADPLDAPIWCAFYDTLGVAGILSAGATANNNVNIDNVGDLPSACSSEYMISVTATNNNDVRTFSGYGQTTVDLGAPGEDVRTTAAGGGYSTTSGTSFATPATAGAIALVYSAPCASLAVIAHSDPALAAQMVRDAIFNGIDPIPNLTTECVTGGRLNVKGALDQILNNCSSGGCIPPFSITASGITDVVATMAWNSLSEIDTFNISYGMDGGAAFAVPNLTAHSYGLSGLTACTDYWFIAQSVCDGVGSDWSDTLFFRTDGCCEAPSTISYGNLSDISVGISWPPVLAADSYVLRWREVGVPTWNEITGITTLIYWLTELEACTEYEIQVATVCDGTVTEFGPLLTIKSTGCGACTDQTFCASSGNNEFEFISNVTVDVLNNSSVGDASGYADFTGMSVDLRRNGTYDVSFSPGFANQSYTEHFRVWIDLNQNGIFSNAELLFDDVQGSQSTVTGTITIPMNADLGSARMRVSMAYGTQFSGAYPQTSCDEGQDGEVEDYCVNILEEDTTGIGIQEASIFTNMDVYPVPATDILNVELRIPFSGIITFQIMDAAGRSVENISTASERTTLDIHSLAKGVYVLRAMTSTNELVGIARIVKE
ncbi:MAG: S8 family serine peptidase [Flavobacteriales bacterium]|nr:S8 family serine peptidase [Flavobacteriales bacterium]